jgi:hypothetical protein
VTCHDYIAQHAIVLAQAVRHFLAREIPYRQLEDLSWQLLSHWQALPAIPIDKEPASEQEGLFWHLLHSLHRWDEHQLVTDTWLRQQLMACATFFVAEGPCPRHCIGSRP